MLFYHHIISLNKVFLPRGQITLINLKKNFFENFEKKIFSSKFLTFTPETNFEICQMSLSNNFWNLKLRNVKLVGFLSARIASRASTSYSGHLVLFFFCCRFSRVILTFEVSVAMGHYVKLTVLSSNY